MIVMEEDGRITRYKTEKSIEKIIESRFLSVLDSFLELDHAVEDSGDGEVLHKETFNFKDGHEIDLKIVNSESGPYVDAVLFFEGDEITVLEPQYENFSGEYSFELESGDLVYKAIVKG